MEVRQGEASRRLLVEAARSQLAEAARRSTTRHRKPLAHVTAGRMRVGVG